MAARLEWEGHEIFWFTTSAKWQDWLIKNGVSGQRIILLRRNEAVKCSSGLQGEVVRDIERKTGYYLKGFVMMDRIIRKWCWSEAESYLQYLINKLQNFFIMSDIDIVIGEGAVLHELVASALCSYIDIKFFNASTIRIPSEKFGFFRGHLQSEIMTFAGEDAINDKLEQELMVYERVIQQKEKPNYWYWFNTKPVVDKSFIKTVINKVQEALLEPHCKMYPIE